MYFPSERDTFFNAGLLLAHLLRRGPNIKPALDITSVGQEGGKYKLTKYRSQYKTLDRCWFNVETAS